MDGAQGPVNGLPLLEAGLTSILDDMPTLQSTNDTGYFRIHYLELKAHEFLSPLQLFGLTVCIQLIRVHKPIHMNEKRHVLHSTRVCARHFVYMKGHVANIENFLSADAYMIH
ncbi:putative effector protein [Golovinomyces cichoracearum]|uniref:Putative effector protein n=1 Tax=Golovinomyces cichoracearum TaxID=62708 RepID=A0A420IST3_9PEZI|nr:putative effector protein [Golovinomyces cichoracearum]